MLLLAVPYIKKNFSTSTNRALYDYNDISDFKEFTMPSWTVIGEYC